MRSTTLGSCLVLFAAASPAAGQIRAELVASGFTEPLYLCAPPADTQRLFVLERAGRVRIVRDSLILVTPFLDIEPLVVELGEGGMLGLAFHPDYAANGRFFVSYTNGSLQTVVAEYAVSADPDVADPTPVQRIFTMPHSAFGHFGGCLQFGPDDLLYFSTGDGGLGEVAQDGLDDRGKLLRLDVDLPPPFVPPSNPFVGDGTVNDEIWALGLRNPWRFSFDRQTGELWIGDVGQGLREEIDFQPADSPGGENYGWPCLEGGLCNDSFQLCTCGDPTLVEPVIEYSHLASSDYNCVIGGYVYRGAAIPSLQGQYVHGDFISSEIWSFVLEDGRVTHHRTHTMDLEPDGELTIDHVSSFGEDALGELYITDPGMNFGAGEGEIWKIVPAPCDVGTLSCYGIGCPCGNDDSQAGCASSTWSGAFLTACGSTSVASDDLRLIVSGLPANQFGILFMGGGTSRAPFGDGILCVAPVDIGFCRFSIQNAGDQGMFTEGPGIVAFTQGPGGACRIDPGETWHFQGWYRDPLGPCGALSNLSNAVSVTFTP